MGDPNIPCEMIHDPDCAGRKNGKFVFEPSERLANQARGIRSDSKELAEALVCAETVPGALL